MKRLLLLIILLATTGYADVDTGVYYDTGNDLLPDCQAAIRTSDDPNYYSPADIGMADKCYGYIEGSVDSFEDNLAIGNSKAYNQLGLDLYQMPTIQVCRITVNYMLANPRYLNLRASTLIDAALIQNFNLLSKK